jgi:hypothetical protein
VILERGVAETLLATKRKDHSMFDILMSAHRTFLYWGEKGEIIHAEFGSIDDEYLVQIDTKALEFAPHSRDKGLYKIKKHHFGINIYNNDHYFAAEPHKNSTRPLSITPRGFETFAPMKKELVLSAPPKRLGKFSDEIARFKAEVDRLRSDGQPVKLHVGCAQTIKPGFLNLDVVDAQPSAAVTHTSEYFIFPYADEPWGIDTESVDFIFHEDFIEHISQLNQIQFLAEAFRVLKKGCVHRVSTPNLMGSMLHHSNFSAGLAGVYTGEKKHNHISIFTPASLAEIATMIGYSKVLFTEKNGSTSPLKTEESRPHAARYWPNGNIHADLIK